MPNSAGDKSQRRSDEILAGEYVLAVLSRTQMRALDDRMRVDPQFAAVVQRWQRNLQRVEIEDRVNAQAVYDQIYGEPVFWQAQKRGLLQRITEAAVMAWRSIVVWRTATAFLLLYTLVALFGETG